MTRAYNVVDADGHILEPLSLWDEYIDPGFRERRPRFVIDENGKERLSVEGKLLGNPRGIGSLGAVGVRQGAVKLDGEVIREFDLPRKRVENALVQAGKRRFVRLTPP